jgi:mRNA interferase MazF
MQSTTRFSRGEVVLVPFQFSESEQIKHRPAVIVSSDAYHAGRADVIVAAVTSRIRRPLLIGDSLIDKWQEAGLSRPSVATAILRTIKRDMIALSFGALDPTDLVHYESSLRTAVEL